MLVRGINALEDPADAGNKVLVETLCTLLQICYFGGRAQLWEPFNVALGRSALARVHRRTANGYRATSDARRHLSAAREIFSQLGAAPWAARAGSELRATGQPAGHDQRPDPVTLTPQQREIATLAAADLTDKQIGERLYLSHRTVGAHLYQIFPKLGVTSRAALRDALSSNEDREEANR